MKACTRSGIAIGLALAASGGGLVFVGPASADPAPTTDPIVEALRVASLARGLNSTEVELTEMAANFASLAEVNAFLEASAGSPPLTEVVIPGASLPQVVAAGSNVSCSNQVVRYAKRFATNGADLMWHDVRVNWCWNNNSGSVTTFGASRAGYATTLVGQAAGYRWTDPPVVRSAGRYLDSSSTDKNGVTTQYWKGRATQMGHWAQCPFTGPFSYLCPIEKDASTEVVAGTWSATWSRSWDQ